MAGDLAGTCRAMTQPLHSDRPDAAGPNPVADDPGVEEERPADPGTRDSEAGPNEPGDPDTDEPTRDDSQ
jgi:hypothetical protein